MGGCPEVEYFSSEGETSFESELAAGSTSFDPFNTRVVSFIRAKMLSMTEVAERIGWTWSLINYRRPVYFLYPLLNLVDPQDDLPQRKFPI